MTYTHEMKLLSLKTYTLNFTLKNCLYRCPLPPGGIIIEDIRIDHFCIYKKNITIHHL